MVLFGLGWIATVITAGSLVYYLAFSQYGDYISAKRTGSFLHIGAHVEAGLGVICANAPDLAALVRNARKKGQTSFADSPRGRSTHYELREPNSYTTLWPRGDRPSDATEEDIPSKKAHVVQSTQLTVEHGRRDV